MRFVTLQQASDHLRRDTNADDANLTLLIEACSQAVADALKDDGMVHILDSAGEIPLDSNGDPIVPKQIQWATLLVLADAYTNRGDDQSAWEPDRLPPAAWALLNGAGRVPGLR